MQVVSQPYSGGPAILKNFGSAQMKSIILSGEFVNESLIKKSLGICGTKFSTSMLLPGGPNELSEFYLCSKEPKILLTLSGFGYCIAIDCRNDSPYKDQITIFRLAAAKEEAIYIPKGFAAAILFLAQNCLFLELGDKEKVSLDSTCIKPKINFEISCGIAEKKLTQYKRE